MEVLDEGIRGNHIIFVFLEDSRPSMLCTCGIKHNITSVHAQYAQGSPRCCDANGSVIAVVRRLPFDLYRKGLAMMFVSEEDEDTRMFLQELPQPAKKAQVVVTDLLHRTTDGSQGDWCGGLYRSNTAVLVQVVSSSGRESVKKVNGGSIPTASVSPSIYGVYN